MSYVIRLKQETSVIVKTNGKRENKVLLSNTKYLINDPNNEQAKILKLTKGNLIRPATQSEESICEHIDLF